MFLETSLHIIMIGPASAFIIATFINKRVMWKNFENKQRYLKIFSAQMTLIFCIFITLILLMPRTGALSAFMNFEASFPEKLPNLSEEYNNKLNYAVIRTINVVHYLILTCVLMVGELIGLGRNLVDTTGVVNNE